MWKRCLLLSLLLLSAGCIGIREEAPQAFGAPNGAPTAEPVIGLVQTAAGTATPTLLEPPVWQAGQWWRYEITEGDGEPVTVTRVVAGQVGDQYLVGMPADDWQDRYLVLHLPGFTEVAVDDLSFEVHDATFKPLDFPLTEGRTWDTGFHQAITDGGLAATASVVSDTVAEVELLGPGGHIQLTYDATVGTITDYRMESYPTSDGMRFQVVDHGCCFEGDVLLGLGQDVALLQAHVASVVDGMELGPAPPVRTTTIDGDYDRITLATIVGELPLGGPALPVQKGVYGVRVETPTGETVEALVTPVDGPGQHATYTHLDHPNGAWTIAHVGAGAGVTLVEGIAYQAYRVTLPAGTVASDVSG